MSGKLTGLGYIPAGYSGFRGLGDAAYDSALLAYQAAHATWQGQMTAYQNAYATWSASNATQQQNYQNALTAYQADLAQWNNEVAAYNAAHAAYLNQAQTNQANYAAAQQNATSQYPGIVFPAGYPHCVTQTESLSWQQQCAALQSVRGLGALSAPKLIVPTGPACGLALLPVCAPVIAAPKAVRPQPQPPAPVAVRNGPVPPGPEPQPPAPPAALGPPPQAPTTPGPSVTQNPYSDTTPLLAPSPTAIPAATTATGGLLSNGLLLVVLAGGGYLVYRSMKKPKPKAA
jgi:hypothetical protein